MTIQDYITSLKTFKPYHKEWDYLPNECENKVCCSDDPEPKNHGMIEWGGQYSPIIICDDCKYQIDNKLYDKRVTEWGLI